MATKLLEITSTTPDTVSVDSALTLGRIDRKISCGNNCGETFSYTAGSTSFTINQPGYYLIIYKMTMVSTVADQQMVMSLNSNGAVISTVSSFASTLGSANSVEGSKIVRLFPNCSNLGINNIPVTFNITNTGTASTTVSESNIIVIKIA